MDRLTQSLIDPHSPLWATLADEYELVPDDAPAPYLAHHEVRTRTVRYGKHVVTKQYTVITTRPNTNA